MKMTVGIYIPNLTNEFEKKSPDVIFGGTTILKKHEGRPDSIYWVILREPPVGGGSRRPHVYWQVKGEGSRGGKREERSNAPESNQTALCLLSHPVNPDQFDPRIYHPANSSQTTEWIDGLRANSIIV
jgi:hypothetical protein